MIDKLDGDRGRRAGKKSKREKSGLEHDDVDESKKDWSKEYKEKHGYDKVKRNFDDWDASFCPTGLTTCPIISNGVFTGDSEW